MSINVTCTCGKSYRVGGDKAGKRMRCKACGSTVAVPAVENEFEIDDDEFNDVEPGRSPQKPLGRSRQTQRGSATAGRKSRSRSHKKKSSGNKTVLISVGAFAGAAVLALVLVLVFSGGDDTDEKQGGQNRQTILAGNNVRVNTGSRPANTQGQSTGNTSEKSQPKYDPAKMDKVMRTKWCAIKPTLELVVCSSRVHSFALLPDGSKLLTSVVDKVNESDEKHELQLWDIASGKKIASLDLKYTTDLFALSPDGKTLAVRYKYSELWLCDTETLEPRKKIEKFTGSHACFSPDGKFLAYVESKNDNVQILDLQTEVKRGLTDHRELVDSLTYLRDGKILIGTLMSHYPYDERPGTFLVWDIGTGKLKTNINFKSSDTRIHGVSLDAESNNVVIGTRDGELQILDSNTGDQLSKRKIAERVYGIASWADGRQLAIINSFDDILLWDAEQHEIVATFGRHEESIFHKGRPMVEFSADGQTLAGLIKDNVTISIWDTSKEKIAGEQAAFDADKIRLWTMKDLGRRFVADKIAFTQKYSGEDFEIEGSVSFHFPSESLYPPRELRFVLSTGRTVRTALRRPMAVCEIRPDLVSAVPTIWSTQPFSFRGRFHIASSNLFFNDCEILKIGPDPRIKVTAVDLTRDVVKDESAAYKKYKGKDLLVTGKLLEYKELEDGFYRVNLEGFVGPNNQKTYVSVGISNIAFQKLQKKKPPIGEMIQVVGSYFSFDENELFLNIGFIP